MNEQENVDVKVDTKPTQTTESNETTGETVAVPKGRFAEFMKSIFGESEKEEPPKDEKPKESKPPKAPDVPDFEKRLAEEKAKWEAEIAKKQEIDKLPEVEKAKAEADAQKAELAEAKKKLAERELKDEAVTYLSAEGYPVGLADLLDLSSKGSKDKSLEKAIDIYQKGIASGLKDKLKGKTPIGLGTTNENSLQSQIAQNIRGGIR